MAGNHGSFKGSYFDIVSVPSVGAAPAGTIRLWSNANDGGNFYATDELNNDVQITTSTGLATGNAQYLWETFTNGSGAIIPNYSVVRIIRGGLLDGQIALSDNDEISKDTFLGITYGGAIGVADTGKVIYAGKVPGAVAGLGLLSNTMIYMSNVPGQFTSSLPDFQASTIFVLGFTRGDDLYLRPFELSDLG